VVSAMAQAHLLALRREGRLKAAGPVRKSGLRLAMLIA